MAEQIPSGQEPQPSAEDVVVFSPELLKLAKQRQEHLEECRQAADSGDCAAAVQMGVNYLYGTGGVQKDPEQAFLLVQPVRPGRSRGSVLAGCVL